MSRDKRLNRTQEVDGSIPISSTNDSSNGTFGFSVRVRRPDSHRHIEDRIHRFAIPRRRSERPMFYRGERSFIAAMLNRLQENLTILSYRADLLRRHLSSATVNRRLSAIRSLLKLERRS